MPNAALVGSMKSPSTILKVVSSKTGTKLSETTKRPGIWRILNRTTGLYGEKAHSLPYNCPTHNESRIGGIKWINKQIKNKIMEKDVSLSQVLLSIFFLFQYFFSILFHETLLGGNPFALKP